ncbi:cytochrome P450 [Rhizorhabdus dicambivorans]|uniref:Cytochrome P450 n=1 Tax=Rhizorhabdus dicambivorans TaxID=1850238 RepID=A0A2A4FW83_9SPHN|nr:cytochrome P450 [Rhizorhabdus dicambivorans]ATE65599.1 cytochrome P450 [Rhizorhabdus dicambivorans]PCE41942.1 cytochrome P450 [Rhizorhabdus dicambivorans]
MIQTAEILTRTDFDGARLVDVDIFAQDFKRRPYAHFSRWTTEAPFYVEAGGAPQAVVARHSAVMRAFSDHEYFSSRKRPWPGMEKYAYFQGLPVVADSDPPDHTRLRRLMTPAFTPRRISAIEDGLALHVDAMLDRFETAGRFDAAIDYGRELAAHILFALLLDLPQEAWPIFLRIAHAMSTYNDLSAGDSPAAAFIDAWAEGRAYCEAMIDEQRRRPSDSVVAGIIDAHNEEGRITTDELLATLFTLYIAGHGGIANTVAWTLLRLCQNPDQLDLLRREPERIMAAVDEGIRHDPSGYHVLRFATHDFEFEGLRLWRDMPVLIISGAPNYDPARYPDPLRFDIAREGRRDITAFGYGVHHCIGMLLSRRIGRIAIEAPVRRFARLRLADPGFEPGIVGGPKERGPDSVPLLIG